METLLPRAIRNTATFVAGITGLLAIACATAHSVAPFPTPPAPENKPGSLPRWPDSWGIEFGLGCAATGEDLLICACIAKEVQKKWTPEQFSSVGPDGLRDVVRLCSERVQWDPEDL